MFQKITKAYETLSNKETRKEYDLYYLVIRYFLFLNPKSIILKQFKFLICHLKIDQQIL